MVSAAAVLLAVEHEIPLYFLSATGSPEARLDSIYFKNLPAIRRNQVLFAFDTQATAWVISLFDLKLAHQFDNFVFIKNRKSALAQSIEAKQTDMLRSLSDMKALSNQNLSDVWNNLMGIEGSMAKTYWQIVAEALGDPSLFEKRSRRPAEDSFNAVLNYAYGMLYNVVECGVLAAGLDPQLGFLHADDYARPTLVFDMIEPFRPWIDCLIIEQFLLGKVESVYFTAKDNGIFLNAEGKRWLIPLFNAFMEEKSRFQEKQLSHRNHINRFAGEFAQRLLKYQKV